MAVQDCVDGERAEVSMEHEAVKLGNGLEEETGRFVESGGIAFVEVFRADS